MISIFQIQSPVLPGRTRGCLESLHGKYTTDWRDQNRKVCQTIEKLDIPDLKIEIRSQSPVWSETTRVYNSRQDAYIYVPSHACSGLTPIMHAHSIRLVCLSSNDAVGAKSVVTRTGKIDLLRLKAITVEYHAITALD